MKAWYVPVLVPRVALKRHPAVRNAPPRGVVIELLNDFAVRRVDVAVEHVDHGGLTVLVDHRPLVEVVQTVGDVAVVHAHVDHRTAKLEQVATQRLEVADIARKADVALGRLALA
jgi:hypothetical protein